MERLLAGQIRFPDRAEKNESWDAGWRLFTAGTLSRIAPDDKAVVKLRGQWTQIIDHTFRDGSYDPDRQDRAVCSAFGLCRPPAGYLSVAPKYTVPLIGDDHSLRTSCRYHRVGGNADRDSTTGRRACCYC